MITHGHNSSQSMIQVGCILGLDLSGVRKGEAWLIKQMLNELISILTYQAHKCSPEGICFTLREYIPLIKV